MLSSSKQEVGKEADAYGLPSRNEVPIIEDSKLADEDEGAVMNTTHQRRTSSRIWDFSCHGKLYGRAKETEELLEVYRRVSTPGSSKTEFVLVSGDSGAGKTAVAKSIRETVISKDGYFVMGKFDQVQRAEPHTAIVAAFAEFTTYVLEKGEARVSQIRERVNERLASEGKILTDMIPDLKKILGEQENLNFFGHSSEAVNRFKYVFRMFLRGVSSRGQPLVIFLDDMHWADEASLDLLESLLSDGENEGIMLLGTYRDNGDSSAERLKAMLSKLDNTKVTVTDIKLGTFEEEAVNGMLADVLMFDRDRTKPLASVVCNQTKGNIFFILEFLRALTDTGMLHFDSKKGQWTWDTQEIRVEFGSNLNELIRAKVALLPAKAQKTLKLASCLGSRVDEDILKLLMGEPVFSYLQLAESKGLIVLDRIRGGYTFSHDGVLEETYQLIPERERKAFHLKIGRKLWKIYDGDELEGVVFAIVGQLMIGSCVITDTKEKYAVAALCLRAGERAVQLSSFRTAYLYLLHGISLLGASCWVEDYKLSLGLYNAASEVAYCTGSFENVNMFVQEIFTKARCFEDTLRGQASKVYSLGSSGKINEATATGLEVLKKLGETFPKKSTMPDADAALKKLKKRLKGRSDESLLRLPNMTDPEKLAAMQMLNLTFLYAFLGENQLAPLLGFRMVSLSLDHGLSAVSCVGFVVMAMMLCGFGNDIDAGYRFGKLGFRMYEKFKSKPWLGRVSAAYFGCVHPWKKPIQETLEPLKYAHRVGLETGDIEFAMLNANIYCWSQFDITPLPALDKEISAFNESMEFYGQKLNIMMMKSTWQMMKNLMGHAKGDPKVLTGEIMEESMLEQWKHENISVYTWSHFHRMLLAYLFGDYDRAEQFSQGCLVIADYPWGAVDVAIVIFFDALTALAKARASNQKKAPLAEKRLRRLQYWANHSPRNFLGKQFLLEAEMAALAGQHDSAFSKYTCAIALSREGGFIMQAALANERTGKYLLERDDKESAVFHIREAISLYKRWGATAKVKALKDEMKDTF